MKKTQESIFKYLKRIVFHAIFQLAQLALSFDFLKLRISNLDCHEIMQNLFLTRFSASHYLHLRQKKLKNLKKCKLYTSTL